MIKNKIKYLIALGIGLLATPFDVNATSGWVSQGSHEDPSYCDIANYGKDENGNQLCYRKYKFTINYNGKNYTDAICGDFGLSMGNSDNAADLTCSAVTDDVLKYILNPNNGFDYEIRTLAARAIAEEKGYRKEGSYTLKEYGPGYQEQVNNLITLANNYANVGIGNNEIKFTKSSSSGSQVTYSLSSQKKIEHPNFSCDGCKIVGEPNWNGTSGSITVEDTGNDCNFNILITYNSADADDLSNKIVMKCTGEAKIQTLFVLVDGESVQTENGNSIISNGNQVTQKFSGKIDSGSYYETYCKNKCNGHTQIEIPEYCDNPNEEDQITITSPTDVINDVIGCDDDAGKTYQSHQLANNPYCSVWCKEDYRMELPGAQYTTSGRYFELKDTKVHVERTCYAGNGTKETDKTDGINIDQFIKDAIAQQKLIVQRYNAYKRIEREIELINAKTEPTATYQGKKSDCTDGNTYNYFEVPEDKYQGYEIEKCDEKTGKCTVRKKEFSTTAYWWGTKITESKETTNTDGTKTCTQTTESKPKPVLNKDAALNNLKDAVNGLGTINEHMENCYNWINDLCYGPDVEFDYNEQYSTDINYERDGENPTSIDGKNATYGVGEKIDNQYSAELGASLETIDYLFCDKDGCDNLNHEGDGYNNTANDISTLEKKYYYRKIKTEGDATYKNKQSFISNYPHGTIDKAPEGEIHENYEYLGAVFPVALKTPIGVYKWTLNFLNVGQYNDFNGCSDAALGRLNDVAKVVHNNNLSTDIGYVCVYVVDCPECDYECVCPDNLPDGYTCEKLGKYNCVITEPECPECEVRCINCIFDGDDTIYYRTISLNYDTDDLNPNNRELGPNWDKETNEKAKDTLKEMEKGEEAYLEAEYTFVITPTHMKAIRVYNRDTGTYVAEDLTYGEVEGVSNIAGYSKFLRGESLQYSDTTYNTKFFKSAKLNTKWELWTSGIKDAVVPVNNNIGPAWK